MSPTYNQGSTQLLSNGTATGSAADWSGGTGAFAVSSGTFNGSTVKLQWTPDGGTTWLDVDQGGDTYVTLTAVGAGRFELPPCGIRAAVTGGSPTGINAFAKRIGG